MRRISILLLILFAFLASAAWPQAQTNPKHHQYKLYDLGTLGGPNSSTSFFSTSLTNWGVIGGAQTAAPDPFNPNCLGGIFSLTGCYVMHAFQWNRGILTDLGALPGNNDNNSSFSSAINNNGLIAGLSENGSVDSDTGYPETRAVVWNKGKIKDLGTFGGTQSSAMAVNDLGQVVGGALNKTDDPFSAEFVIGFGVLYSGTTQVRAFVWQNGRMRDLGTLGGPDAFAYAINQFGQIAGESYTSYTPNADTGIPTVDPFLWTNGKMIDLGTLGGTIGFPVWLNDWGQVVGYSNLAGDQFYHGFLWERGAIKDLPPASGGDYSWALWINDLGDVSGGSTLPGDQQNHASLWRFGKSSDLGTVGQDPCSEALSVNDLQQIVGASYPCSNEQAGRAFLWENGGPMVNLNALLENPSDLYLDYGTYINDSGEIVAQGVLPNGDFHAALLVPDGDCKEDCEQRILTSQNAPVVRANAGSTSPAFGKEAKWLRNRLEQRYALPGQH
jgi:probable HAF family extracellular repeat protein